MDTIAAGAGQPLSVSRLAQAEGHAPFRSIVTHSFIAVMLRVVLAPFLYITINVSAFSSRCTWMHVFRVLWTVMDRTLSPVNETNGERYC